MNPDSATVILFFNKAALTLRCFESVVSSLSKQSQKSHRIIFVDNGSSIAEAEKVRVGATKGKPSFCEVSFVRMEENQGFAKGMNKGLKEAFSNPAVQSAVTLSNDVELDEKFFLNLLPASRAEILCPAVYYLKDRQKPSYSYGELDLKTWQLSHHVMPEVSAICFPQYYPAAAMVWNRDTYKRLQGFDERFFCYWEDVELSYRCSKLGVVLRFAPELKVHHLGRGTTGGKSLYFTKHFSEGRVLCQKILRTNSICLPTGG